MAALEPSLPSPRMLHRSPTPAATITVAAPSSPPSTARDMLSPSNSPASPSVSSKRLQSPPAVGSRALSAPTSPSAPDTNTLNASTMSATLATPAPASSNSKHHQHHDVTTSPPTKKVLERNQACLGCRQRKRKCDGGKPNCGACDRLERQCVYTHNAVTKIHSSAHYHRDPPSNPRPRTSASHDSPSSGLAVPSANRHSSHPATGFTAVNIDVLASGGRSAQPSPPGRLSPHLANGNTNTRKRSFSSLNSSPSASHYASHGISHHHNNNNHLRNLTGNSDATRFASQFLQASPFVGFEFDASSPAIVIETMSQDDMPDLTEEGLPLQPLIKELFTLFFDKWHSMLPCLYKKRILSEIAPGGPLTRPNTLTFAILALAGYLHPNPGVKYASHKWAALGKECFDHAVLGGKFTMQAVQGGIYLCLRMFGLAQMSEMWMFLGMVWRMCLPLGFHQIDSSLPAQLRGFIPEPRNELELEERRRTVWAVYILDRLTGISVPWTMCVVDSEFCVNFPVSEEIFQNGSMENVEHMIIDPFPANLDSLLPSAMGAPTAPRDAYQYLCKLAVLLGRILSYTRSSNRPLRDYQLLIGTLSRFMLGIPKHYRAATGAPAVELPTVLLLGCTLNACSIFLHSSSTDEGRSEDCFKAVENILALIRNVSSTLDLTDDRVLGNPLLAPILLLGARILAGRFLASGSATEEGVVMLNHLELLLGSLGRMEEGWPRLAGLVKGIVREDLKREPGA